VTLYSDSGSSTTGTTVQNNNNNFSNITLTGATTMAGWFNNDGTGSTPVKTMNGNTFSNWTCGTSAVNVLQCNFGGNANISNNAISNITGQGAVTAILRGSSGTVAQLDIANNVISNVTSTSTGGTVIGVSFTHASTLANINSNTISLLSSTGASVTGINSTAGTTVNLFKNNVNNLSSSNTNAVVSGIAVGGGTTVNVYNNFVSDLRAASSTGLNSVIGLNFSGGTTVNASYNTVYLGSAGSLTGGATFGGSGVYVSSSTALNLKNNIVNVKATGVTGYFSALKRSTGTALTKPSNVTATNNIYFVSPEPYIYGEGTTLSTATNVYYNAASGYTGTADPNFNTACGLYKVFMAENGTFWEDNLVAGMPTGTFSPSGASYAESNATGSTTPSISDDFAGTARSATPDCGALEFSGTLTDAAGPSISYTNIPNPANICAAVTLSATITDPSMVNTTAGTAPRLWYKKQTNTDALPGTNDNTTDGWKYVEATGSYTFTVDYNKIFGGVAGADVIQYFVVAQDNAGTPNVSTVSANYFSGFCPSSVALASGAFPLANTTGLRTFTIPAFGTATAGTTTASNATICVSGTTSIGMTPTSGTTTGFVFDVQSSPAGAGTWTTVATGLTSLPYTTGTITASTDYQVIAKNCNGTPLFTAALVAVTVNNPQITGTTPGSRCGTGTVTLGAMGSGSGLRWYSAASGGTPLGTNSTYTTPIINNTTTYYVAAVDGGSTEAAGRPTYSGTDNTTGTQWGLVFNVVTSSITLNSVDVFSVGTGGNLTVELRDNAGTLLQTSASVSYPAGSTASPVQVTIPLGFTVPVGTGYRLVMGSMGGNLIRNSSLGGFPYTSTSGNVVVTNGYISGTSTTYYWFYNWSVSTGCESARTPVTATVNAPPVLTLSAASSTICSGTPSALVTVTSTPGDYNTYTWNPATGVSGDQNSGFVFNPTTSTNYTLTAAQTGGQLCQNTATHNVTVNPVPTGVTASATPTTLCAGGTINLTSTYATLVGSGMDKFTATRTTGTSYTSIIPATNITAWRNGTSTDDNLSENQPIGFSFVYDGVAYTNFRVSTNGFVTFNTTSTAIGSGTGAYGYSNSWTVASGGLMVAPNWDDLQTAGNLGTQADLNASINYSTTGVAPNRVLTVEWKNMQDFNTTSTASYNFQVKIYEAEQRIEFVYGTMTQSAANVSYSLGLSGATVSATPTAAELLSQTTVNTGTFGFTNQNALDPVPASNTTVVFLPGNRTFSWSGPNSFTSNLQNPSISNAPAAASGTYILTVTNTTTGCSSTASVTVTVNASVGGTVSSNQTINSGSSPADLTLSGQTGSVVQWEYSTDAAFTAPMPIANTTTTLTSAEMGPLTADRWYRAVVQNGTCTSAYSASVKITVISAAVTVNAKVFLSNVSGSTMQGDLRTLLIIPLNDPYADTGLPYAGSNYAFVPAGQMATTTQTIIDNNNVIDWVFVELRTGSSGATSVVASKSGLLKEDGTIINPDGTAFSFTGVSAGNYFVAIKHRNHCGFMTNAATALPNASLLDFYRWWSVCHVDS